MSLPGAATVIDIVTNAADPLQASARLCDLLDEADLDYDRDEMSSALEATILANEDEDEEDLASDLLEVMQEHL